VDLASHELWELEVALEELQWNVENAQEKVIVSSWIAFYILFCSSSIVLLVSSCLDAEGFLHTYIRQFFLINLKYLHLSKSYGAF
jgi:hypothetical protein